MFNLQYLGTDDEDGFSSRTINLYIVPTDFVRG